MILSTATISSLTKPASISAPIQKPTLMARLAPALGTYWGHTLHPIDAVAISRFFFYPKEPIKDLRHKDFNKNNVREVYFHSADGRKLHGLYIPSDRNTDQVTLFCHGRSGNVNDWAASMITYQKGLQDAGLDTNVFLFDYRGYGESEGKRPTRLTAPKDAYAAWCHLRSEFSPGNIHIVGHSNGAAIALETTTMLDKYRIEKPGSLTLVSPYLSPIAATQCKMPIIGPFACIVGPWILNPKRLITKIHPDIPVALVHSEKDEYFPVDHSVRLHELCSSRRKHLLITERGDHVNTFAHLNNDIYSSLATLFDNQS